MAQQGVILDKSIPPIEFHIFPKLPPEIRQKIWGKVAAKLSPQLVRLWVNEEGDAYGNERNSEIGTKAGVTVQLFACAQPQSPYVAVAGACMEAQVAVNKLWFSLGETGTLDDDHRGDKVMVFIPTPPHIKIPMPAKNWKLGDHAQNTAWNLEWRRRELSSWGFLPATIQLLLNPVKDLVLATNPGSQNGEGYKMFGRAGCSSHAGRCANYTFLSIPAIAQKLGTDISSKLRHIALEFVEWTDCVQRASIGGWRWLISGCFPGLKSVIFIASTGAQSSLYKDFLVKQMRGQRKNGKLPAVIQKDEKDIKLPEFWVASSRSHLDNLLAENKLRREEFEVLDLENSTAGPASAQP